MKIFLDDYVLIDIYKLNLIIKQVFLAKKKWLGKFKNSKKMRDFASKCKKIAIFCIFFAIFEGKSRGGVNNIYIEG